jgi:hypothetical protein
MVLNVENRVGGTAALFPRIRPLWLFQRGGQDTTQYQHLFGPNIQSQVTLT